jgi:hypothetical protein
MRVFTTKEGHSIDLESVFAVSQLRFDWRSDYGVHSHESDWYVQLGVKGKEQPLKFSLGCAPTVLRTDTYDSVQEKRSKSSNYARMEYTRLMEKWTYEPK